MATPTSTNQPPEVPGGRRWLWGGCALAAVLASAAWLGWHQRDAISATGEAEPKHAALVSADAETLASLKALARDLLGADRMEEAGPVLTQWCQLRPDDAEPYRLRMHQRHRLGFQGKTVAQRLQLQELALADGRRVLELTSDDDSAAQEVVWLCLAVGRFEEADPVCRRCRERHPDDLWLRYLQARVCHARGANGEAAALLDALLLQQPKFARGILLRALLHFEANETEKAIPLFRQVVDQDKDLRQEARYHLGLALARAGHAEEARQVMAEVQRQNFDQVTDAGHTENPAVQVRRAELLLGVGRATEAVPLLQAVLREDPDSSDAHRLLASHYEQQGDPQKAAEHRRQAKP